MFSLLTASRQSEKNKTFPKDSTEYFPRGSWHSKDTLVDDDEEIIYNRPARLLEQYLPGGGTVLEIYAGACDITYQIAKLGENTKWEIHATDIQATDFLTASRSNECGINLYDINIQDLIKHDLPEKIDVLLCRHAFGRNDGHSIKMTVIGNVNDGHFVEMMVIEIKMMVI